MNILFHTVGDMIDMGVDAHTIENMIDLCIGANYNGNPLYCDSMLKKIVENAFNIPKQSLEVSIPCEYHNCKKECKIFICNNDNIVYHKLPLTKFDDSNFSYGCRCKYMPFSWSVTLFDELNGCRNEDPRRFYGRDPIIWCDSYNWKECIKEKNGVIVPHPRTIGQDNILYDTGFLPKLHDDDELDSNVEDEKELDDNIYDNPYFPYPEYNAFKCIKHLAHLQTATFSDMWYCCQCLEKVIKIYSRCYDSYGKNIYETSKRFHDEAEEYFGHEIRQHDDRFHFHDEHYRYGDDEKEDEESQSQYDDDEQS
jgi:hypothetical protein